jgi:hypothetical protein
MFVTWMAIKFTSSAGKNNDCFWPKAAIPECLLSRRCRGLSGRRPEGSRCLL